MPREVWKGLCDVVAAAAAAEDDEDAVPVDESLSSSEVALPELKPRLHCHAPLPTPMLASHAAPSLTSGKLPLSLTTFAGRKAREDLLTVVGTQGDVQTRQGLGPKGERFTSITFPRFSEGGGLNRASRVKA